MQPTNKLRWVYKTRIIEEYPSGVKTAQQYQVLQQWWEGEKVKKEYEHLPPGSLIPWDGKSELFTHEPYGEWRDIPIEVEE